MLWKNDLRSHSQKGKQKTTYKGMMIMMGANMYVRRMRPALMKFFQFRRSYDSCDARETLGRVVDVVPTLAHRRHVAILRKPVW